MSARWPGICIAILTGAVALLLVHGAVYASSGGITEQNEVEAKRDLERFNSIAGSLYTAVDQGDRNGVYYKLRDLAKLAKDRELRRYGNIEGWQAVDRSIRDAQKALEAGANDSVLLKEAARLRLAADSLAMGRSALWLQYEAVLKEDSRQLVIAWTDSGSMGRDAAVARLATLRQHWEMVEPAALLTRDSQQSEMLGSTIQYSSKLLQAQEPVQTGWVMQAITSLTEASEQLFRPAGAEEQQSLSAVGIPAGAGTPGGWLLYTLIPLICSCLAYAAWMNYRGGQHGVMLYPARPERSDRNGVAGKR